MTDELTALESSVAHLREVAHRIRAEHYDTRAYTTEWTIPDVFSHIGSAAVILLHGFDDIVVGREADPHFNQSVWDEWNAKEPAAQVADALTADAVLLERLSSVGEDVRRAFRFSMGPLNLDFDGFVGIRLNEHVLHTWDIEVALDPAATLPSDEVGVVVDNLEIVIRFSAKSPGHEHSFNIHTSNPERHFVLAFGPDSVELAHGDPGDVPDLEMPTEAFVRLAYGRLDEAHTPAGVQSGHLDELRRAFPGL